MNVLKIQLSLSIVRISNIRGWITKVRRGHQRGGALGRIHPQSL